MRANKSQCQTYVTMCPGNFYAILKYEFIGYDFIESVL